MSSEATSTNARSRWGEFVVESGIRVLGFSTIGFVVLIFFFLLREGIPAFSRVPLGNLFGTRWYPTFDLFGTLPLLLGSLLVTVTAIAIALPLGVATAVFVREVAPNWAREILKPMIEVLAGIPSVVLGFFGMTLIAPLIRQGLGHADRPDGVHRRADPGLHGAADDHQRGRGRAGRRAQELSRCEPGDGRHAVADDLARGRAGGPVGHPDGGHAGHGAGHRRDDGGDDGDRQRGAHAAGPGCALPAGAHDDRHHRRRDGRGGQGSTHYHVLFAIGIILFLLTFIINLAAAQTMFQKRRQGGLR